MMDYWSVLQQQFPDLERGYFPNIHEMPHLWVLMQRGGGYLIEVEGETRLYGGSPVQFEGIIAPKELAWSIRQSNGVLDEVIGRTGFTRFDAHGNAYSETNPYGSGGQETVSGLINHAWLGIWDAPGFYNRNEFYPVSGATLGDRFIRVKCAANTERTPPDQSAEFIFDADNLTGLYFAKKENEVAFEEKYLTYYTKYAGPNNGNRVVSFTLDHLPS